MTATRRGGFAPARRLLMAAAAVAAVICCDAGSASGEPADATEPPATVAPPKNVKLARVAVGPSDAVALAAVIEREARRAGLPPEIAEAVIHTESGFNPAAIGADGEIGLMQVMPATARMLGFSGSLSDLAVPETNIRYGVTYLARAYRLADGDLCTAAMKYRAGHGETGFSELSVDYCRRVRARLRARGFVVSGPLPVATFGFGRLARGCGGRRCLTIGGGRQVNLTALNLQLKTMIAQASGGR